jgi:hypothetical protein
MSQSPNNFHRITTGIGFECGPKSCGLEIQASGKVGTAGSGFMRSFARASAFSATCRWLGPRRVMGARLMSVLWSEGDRTGLCDVFGRPRVPQEVTKGLSRGWLDTPVQHAVLHGGYWVARGEREIRRGETVKRYLGSVGLLAGRSYNGALTAELLFCLVAGELGAEGRVAKWELYRPD